jgi:hypothetical protein
MDVFEVGSHELICPGWLQSMILLISAFSVVRITGVSQAQVAHATIL